MSDVLNKLNKIKYLSLVFENNVDLELFKLISMASICRIFEGSQLDVVIGGFLSLYSLMNGTLLRDEPFRQCLLADGVELKEFEIRCKRDLFNCVRFTDSELNSRFLHFLNLPEDCNNQEAPVRVKSASFIFKDRFTNLNFSVGSIVAFTGLCLCLMSKKISKYNYISWFRNKWKVFLKIVGLDQYFCESGPHHSLMPHLNTCKKVYSFFKSHHALRRKLYLGIMKLSWESGLWGNMCRAVLKFSKGLEINHLLIINTYIIQDHSELLCVEELKEEFRKLQTAYQIFRRANIPEQQWPYVKILIESSNDDLGNKHFPILNYLAVHIGKLFQPDLCEYYCKLSPEMKDIADKILKEATDFDSAVKATQAEGQDSSDIQMTQAETENSSNVHVAASEGVSDIQMTTADSNVQVTESEARDGSSAAGKRTQTNDSEFNELLEISNILEKSVYRISGVNIFNEDDSNHIVLPNPLPCTKIIWFKTSDDFSKEMLDAVYLLNVSRIYISQSVEEIIGGLLTLFTLLGSEMLSSAECKSSIEKHGLELCEIILNSSVDLARHFVFEDVELNDLFLKLLGFQVSSFNNQTILIKRNPYVYGLFKSVLLKTRKVPSIIAYIGVCLIVIFKSLEDVNYEKWIKNRWFTYNRVFETCDLDLNFSEMLIPSKSTCHSIYCFFSSNFEFRRILFSKFMKLSKHSRKLSMIFLVICQIAKETEMAHIYLINKYILHDGKIYMKMKELKPELLRFMHALDVFRSKLVSTDDWLYAKLLLHPNEVEALNKRQFPLLLYLAECFHKSSTESSTYAGVGAVPSYFKKIKETADKLKKIKTDRFGIVHEFFKLDFPNDDILCALSDSQLKEYFINSLLLVTCHDKELGVISSAEKERILTMSIEDVKLRFSNWINLLEKTDEKLEELLEFLERILS